MEFFFLSECWKFIQAYKLAQRKRPKCKIACTTLSKNFWKLCHVLVTDQWLLVSGHIICNKIGLAVKSVILSARLTRWILTCLSVLWILFLILDPLMILTGELPSWLSDLAHCCPFIFSFETRQLLFRIVSFDRDRAMQYLYDTGALPETNGPSSSATSSSMSTDTSHRFVPKIEKKKVTWFVQQLFFWLQVKRRCISRIAL